MSTFQILLESADGKVFLLYNLRGEGKRYRYARV